ncbi:MAG: hypothetical protein JOZ41_05610, partial [Chloroflexi bacterium]|nr:hypothetical protein [Chloroflexota bacterium]
FLTMACPNYRDAVEYNTQHPNMQVTYDTSIEPQIDAHGSFVHAVRWKALSLVGYKSMDCTLYALDGVNPFGPAFPPTYTILAPDQPVSPCWRRICIELKERTRRIGSGLVETVHIAPRPVRDREHPVRPGLYAWPGADAMVTLLPPGGPVKQRVRLDMRGEADANFPIAGHLKGPVRVSVMVKVQLGSWSGGDSGKFILSP